MKKLSIAMVVTKYPNIVQTYIVSAITGLQSLSHSVTIISILRPDHLTPELKIIERLPKKVFYIYAEFPQLVFELLLLPIYSPKYIKNMIKLFRYSLWNSYGVKYFFKALLRTKALTSQQYDLVHSHNLTTSYEYLFYKEVFKIPLVTTFHGKEPRGSSTLSTEKQKVLFERSDLFFVNTHFAKHSLIEAGCPESKIQIIPQGTNIKSFPFKSRKIVDNQEIALLTVGRLSKEKGQHVGIKAICHLIKTYPNIKYHLVGNGPEKENLKALITELDLTNNIILHGYATSSELSELYKKAHIFILPSVDLKDGLHVETQGVVIQEAQSSGLPVIASRTGGIPEVIIDGETAFLFEENNSVDLANKIKILISDPEMYSAFQINARSHVEKYFDHIVISSRVANAYNAVIKSQ